MRAPSFTGARAAAAVLLILCSAAAVADDAPLATAPPAPPQVAPQSGPYSWTYGPFEYDPAGNVATIGGNTFLYDPMGRLITSSIQRADQPGSQTQTYTYDAYGNRISINGTSFPASTANNRLTSNGAMYDAAGNLTQWQPPSSAYVRQYTYDALNMMNKEVNGSYSAISIYTADDERLWVLDTLPSGGNVSHWTVRDLGGHTLRDFIDDGTPWRLHREYFYRDGRPLAVDTASGTQHDSVDHLGTPRLVTNGSAHKIFHHHYFPFGEEWTIGGDPVDASTLKFTGHERDDDLRGEPVGTLDYMHARFYSAGLARFLSTDPILVGRIAMLIPQGWNRYTYVFDSPLGYLDPSGRYPCPTMGSDGKTITGDCVDVVAQDPLSQARTAAERDAVLREAEFLRQAADGMAGVENAAAARSMGQHYARRMYEGLIPQGTLVFGVSGSMILPIGGEGSVGVALNTDIDSESHADATGYLGGGVGLDVGVGVFFGWIKGEMSNVAGSTTNVTGSVAVAGTTVVFNNQGKRLGNTASIGPSLTPISASGTRGNTWCLFGCR